MVNALLAAQGRRGMTHPQFAFAPPTTDTSFARVPAALSVSATLRSTVSVVPRPLPM